MFQEDPHEFLLNSNIGIHTVSAEGIITYANQCELDTLGYSEEEYVGHHVSEFQIDKDDLKKMIDKLNDFKTLSNYPSKVQGKYEMIYISYTSSVYKKNDKFIHTRCFGSKIDETVYNVFRKIQQNKNS